MLLLLIPLIFTNFCRYFFLSIIQITIQYNYKGYDNRKNYKQSSLYLQYCLPTRSCLRQRNFSDFAFDIFMREGNCWNLAAQEITQRFPPLLYIVHQQFPWWNEGLNAMIVDTISLTGNTSGTGICRAKNSINIRVQNKVHFSCSSGEHFVKFPGFHGIDNLIDCTFYPRVFFSLA